MNFINFDPYLPKYVEKKPKKNSKNNVTVDVNLT